MSQKYEEAEYPIKRGDSMMSFEDFVSVNNDGENQSAAGSWSLRHQGRSLRDFLQSNRNDHHAVEMMESIHSNLPPALPFILRFRNLTYSVSTRTRFSKNRLQAADRIENLQHKLVLNDVSGEARDGELFAVLGQSGSGKSTLIDALAHRISKDSLKGTVTLNGEPLGGRVLRSISAYVMQDDLLFPMLTVKETLMYAAEFRLPRSCTWEKKRGRVEVLIDQLGLRAAAGTIVGDEENRGVSGGERRRVSIGIDIIHDPILLFLDEPTSGLDSTSAFMVVKTLQRIARTGSVVIMSIHQPSYRILGLLDRLILLARGQTVFSGSPDRLMPYFAEFGHPIPENENSTEFALDLIQELDASDGGVKPLVEFFKSWRRTPKYGEISDVHTRSLNETINASIARGKLVTESNSSGQVADFANPPWVEMSVLIRRAFMNIRRTPALFLMRLATVMVTSFMLATIFWKLDHSPQGIRERLGFFAFAMSTTYYCCADALPIFLQERFIFMRETAYNAYRRSSYVFAQTLVQIPSMVILAVAFAVTTFWAVGLGGGLSGFGFFVLVLIASFWSANSFVTFLSGAVTNLMISYTIVVALLAYFLLLSGFFITRSRIPPYWIWFHYISLIKYPYEAVLQNEFGRADECFARGTQVFDGTPMASLSPQLQMSFLALLRSQTNINITATTCVTKGSDVLSAQDVTQLDKWMCVLVTFCWGFFFRFLFYISLLLGSKNKRH